LALNMLEFLIVGADGAVESQRFWRGHEASPDGITRC
jgi:hypothetical protein